MGKAIKEVKSYPVKLVIGGIQHFPDGRTDEVKYEAEGSLYTGPQHFHIIYEEPGESGLEGIKTLIRADKGKVMLHRWGDAELKQEFQVGQIYDSLYKTQYGIIRLRIRTKDIEHNLTADGGHIRLEYDLFMEDVLTSHNTLVIKIRLA